MTCPACGGELVPGADRCPVCDASVAPRVEGALAADPRLVTPPARPRPRVEPLRDIPGLRKRERTWRDEVQDRVRSRRQKRAEAGLPLFDEPETAPAQAARPEEAPSPAPAEPTAEPAAPRVEERPAFPAREPELVPSRLGEADLADLPLRGPEVDAPELRAPEPSELRAARGVPSLEDEALVGEDLEDDVELSPPVVEPAPLERPARAAERLRAAAVDGALFGALAAVVVYFTGRAARVEVAALASSWPALASYLGLLAMFYAGYFTGTTGQTPGKLVAGLRVVDAAGRPPGYARATARALVGVLGTGLAGLGLLPMAFDPAARALHDRLFRTRVVHS